MSLVQFVETTGDAAKMGIAKIIERYSRLAPILPIKQIDNLTHKFGREVDLGEVGKRQINQPAPETQGSTLVGDEEPIIMLTKKIKIDHRLIALQPNAEGDELARGTRAVARQWDDELVNGDRSDDATSINGLLVRCTGDQLIETADNGDELEIDHVEAALDAVVEQGNGKLILMSRPVYRQFIKKVRAAAGGATIADVTGEVPMYEGARIVVVGDKLDGTPLMGFTETQGTNEETASALVIAPGNSDVELSGVKLLMASNSIEIVPEGIRNSQRINVLEVAFGLAVYDATAVARIKGIAKAA
jgi:hypothetical protein